MRDQHRWIIELQAASLWLLMLSKNFEISESWFSKKYDICVWLKWILKNWVFHRFLCDLLSLLLAEICMSHIEQKIIISNWTINRIKCRYSYLDDILVCFKGTTAFFNKDGLILAACGSPVVSVAYVWSVVYYSATDAKSPWQVTWSSNMPIW